MADMIGSTAIVQRPPHLSRAWQSPWSPRPPAQPTRGIPARTDHRADTLEPPPSPTPVWPIAIPKPPRRGRIPRPPIPRLPLSVRQRLCGGRSLFFIGLMLVRLGMVTFEAVRKTHDLYQGLVGGTIFVLAVIIASPERRLRAPAIGLFTALFWSYALAGSLEAPTLTTWWALMLVGIVAASLENLYSHTTHQIERRQHQPRSASLDALRQQAVALQLVNVLLVVAPVAYVLALDAELYGIAGHPLLELIPLAISLPPVVGVGVYAMYALRRVVTLHAEPDEA
ncbi:MAG: hypothetical protein IT305_23140 [Chloroflexi bacterium]|nr:hypothetical protein [Chloroflexota bacterium]